MAVPSSARVRNLNNEPVTLERDGDKLLADGSAVVARDLMATNGVMHVIDQLMMSQESEFGPHHAFTLRDTVSASERSPAFCFSYRIQSVITTTSVMRTAQSGHYKAARQRNARLGTSLAILKV